MPMRSAWAWRAARSPRRIPEDTDWQQHEGAHVDPDGNVLGFGSPMRRSSANAMRALAADDA